MKGGPADAGSKNTAPEDKFLGCAILSGEQNTGVAVGYQAYDFQHFGHLLASGDDDLRSVAVCQLTSQLSDLLGPTTVF